LNREITKKLGNYEVTMEDLKLKNRELEEDKNNFDTKIMN